jgi:hypothetical protein
MPHAASWSTTTPEAHQSESQRRLLTIAERIADAYVAHTQPRAILLTGSVGEGLADEFSDIDLIVYYDEQPSDSALERAYAQIGCTAIDRKGYVSKFRVDDVQCEVGHFLVEETESRMATVLDDLEVDTLVHKGLMGLTSGRALHGESLIHAWQARAATFPDELRRKMAEFYVNRQFEFWYLERYWPRRDAHLWLYQVLVETCFNVLGILAGVNRLYFSPFQFKRLRQFVGHMPLAPADLANRMDHVFASPEPEAMRDAEQLFLETLELAERELPGLNTSGLRNRPGERGIRM